MRKARIGALAVKIAMALCAVPMANAADKSHDAPAEKSRESVKESAKEVVKVSAKESAKESAKDSAKESAKESPKESAKAASKELAKDSAGHESKSAGKEQSAAKPSASAHAKSSGAGLDEVRQKIEAAIARRQSTQAKRSYASHDTLSLTVRSGDGHGATEGTRTAMRAARGSGSSPASVLPLAALTGHTSATAAGAIGVGHGAGQGDLLTPHWGYDGDGGPAQWGRLKPEFAKCTSGSRQSPIDIRDGVKVELEPIKFSYQSSGFSVVDNGHTIQVNVGPGNTISVLGRRFELLQFHFHRPSEERVNGRRFDMVAHLVHKDGDGRLAVIAVLLERGAAQDVLQTVWNNLPLERNDEVVAGKAIDLNALLPIDRSYFTYMGSLTTPPCTEGVLWMVLRQPVPMSSEQIGIFSRLYPMNARPIQSASGRLIKESN